MDCEVAVVSEPCCFVSSVPCEYVASGVRLEVPGRDQDDVSDSDPDSSFEFSSDSAEAFVTVLAFYHYSFEAEQFGGDSKDVCAAWQLHFAEVFADNFSFSQLDFHLSAGAVADVSPVSVRNTMFFSRFGEGRAVEPNCEGPRVI